MFCTYSSYASYMVSHPRFLYRLWNNLRWCSSGLQGAKLTGTGEQLYTVIGNNCPSAAFVFKAVRLYFENNPYIKLSHFFSMKTILDACDGATRVHVIFYGIQYGTEFPSLMQQLSLRPGGPPHLRITGIHNVCLTFAHWGSCIGVQSVKLVVLYIIMF